MDLIFTPVEEAAVGSADDAAAVAAEEGDAETWSQESPLFDGSRSWRGNLFGETHTSHDASTGSDDAIGAVAAAGRPPDMLAFEAEVERVLRARSDLPYMLGDEVDFQFQHRLWRYGPNFDPKKKGGIWHKDTCPFGINGELPEGAIMFTIVYILYTENLDGPTAGTRVKDSDGTIFSLPCIAGEGNIIRSGESDANAFFHSGPLNIQKLDPDRPAYRVMLQSKAVVRPRDGRRRAIPTKGHWRGLEMPPLVALDDSAAAAAAAGSSSSSGAAARRQLAALAPWLRGASERLTSGVAESNAVRFEAYPINVHRAWEVTRELCAHVGFETDGVLPESDSAATPVVLFGFDERYTEGLIESLQSSAFRVLSVASDTEFDWLRAHKQDVYSNADTADVDDVAKVGAYLDNSPYDIHLVVDVPPIGQRALEKGALLARYGDALARVAAKPKGEGRVASVTLLSQQMPFAGAEPTDAAALDELSATQHAFLALERAWVAFGAAHGVRVVVMRVADRVYAPLGSALQAPSAATPKRNPCRVEDACGDDTPLTRVHSEDLANVLRRMLSMFDIVDTHGADSSMHGSASMESSISRFPSGTVLDVVDDGPADSMRQAELWARFMMSTDDAPVDAMCGALGAEDRVAPPAAAGHRIAAGRNAGLKAALGMPDFLYPTYHHGGAKMFGAGEL